MVSALERSGFEPCLMSLLCVFGQDSLLSKWLSEIFFLGVTRNGISCGCMGLLARRRLTQT